MIWFMIFVLVVAALVYFGRKQNRRPDSPSGHAPSFPASAVPTPRRPLYSQQRTAAPRAPADRIPFAAPGLTGRLFTYGGPRSRSSVHRHDGGYAIVDVETTGFSPDKGDRVIEIAVARVDPDGRVEDEFATLINPEGRDTGPVFVHGITNAAVSAAPTFAEIAPEILARLDGAVVVAHNAPFEERFLAAEFARAGHRSLLMPALCTLWLGQQTFDTPNHRLGTLARHAGIPLIDKHAALGDVRAGAGLLPRMMERYGEPMHYGCAPYRGAAVPPNGSLRLVTRAVELRKGSDGWMHSLMARLPMSASEADDAAVEAYLDALAEVLADRKVVGEEAKALAQLVGGAGMGSAQVRALNERFLESLRDAALEDHVLTAAELRQLKGAAKALGVPGYFDDLQPTVSTSASAGNVAPLGSLPTSELTVTNAGTRARRCGHCRTPGHYRSRCPELA